MLNIGLLRKRLTIQRRTLQQDTMGEQSQVWQDIGQAWGEVTGLSAREQFLSAATRAVDTHQVTLRYFPGLSEADRVLYTDALGTVHLYDLTGIIDEEERHRIMTCTAVEGLKPG